VLRTQNAVFSPIMRVHQMHGIPRFPYNFCGGEQGGGGGAFNGAGYSSQEHCTAFHQALDLRYHFIPYVYSLAHQARKYLRPIAVPAVFNYPGWSLHDRDNEHDDWNCGVRSDGGYDPSCHNSSWSSYMFGSQILTADLIVPGGKKFDQRPFDNMTVAAIPPGMWYRLNTSTAVQGNRLVRETVNVTTFPVYVRAGSVLPLNKERVQYSEAQGGTLLVQVYSGADGSFELFEDDGASLDYKGEAAVGINPIVALGKKRLKMIGDLV
jgi:alpha-glucosidase (family GH31 glycosyl hydrolase)